jgi:hypothetical protein
MSLLKMLQCLSMLSVVMSPPYQLQNEFVIVYLGAGGCPMASDFGQAYGGVTAMLN